MDPQKLILISQMYSSQLFYHIQNYTLYYLINVSLFNNSTSVVLGLPLPLSFVPLTRIKSLYLTSAPIICLNNFFIVYLICPYSSTCLSLFFDRYSTCLSLKKGLEDHPWKFLSTWPSYKNHYNTCHLKELNPTYLLIKLGLHKDDYWQMLSTWIYLRKNICGFVNVRENQDREINTGNHF